MRREDQCGITWDTHTVWGTRRSIDAVEKAISAQSCVMSLRDEVMRLQIRLKAAEDRWANSADAWKPGTYQNGA